jgi:acetylornithine/succinyldiaminopimelate/putrescine aminotransferase
MRQAAELEMPPEKPGQKTFSLAEALDLDKRTADSLFRKHVNAGLFGIYKVLGLAEMDIVGAEGVEIFLRDGRKILDFTSSIGVLSLGHNHPRIIAAERLCQERKILDAIKVAPSKLQAVLAHNLASVLPAPLEVSFFAISGAESVEAAMKLAEKAQGPDHTVFIVASNSYHGKTHGTMGLTRSDNFGEGFLHGVPADHIVEVPYGDIEALKAAVDARSKGKKHDVIGVVVEPMQGQNVALPPKGYLPAVAKLCKERGIVSIFDEVKVGMGRTGTFCAFMAEDVVPDIVTLSKCLGGGKRAIAVTVTTQEIFRRAYGKQKDAGTHTTTFGGLGSSCAVAIEAVNIVADPKFLSEVRRKGDKLRAELERLQAKYPKQIRAVVGRGLFCGVEFNFSLPGVKPKMPRIPFVKTFEVVLMGSIIRELYRKHGVLSHFSSSDPTILHVMPPLIVTDAQMDQYIAALDATLARGWMGLASRFVQGNLKEAVAG